jgi:D-tyrosyl-tRNA(Tyr) deacylase
MLACVQRVSKASVAVEGVVVGRVGQGMLVLLGVAQEDDQSDVRWMADKLVHLRIFSDDEGKMNRSLLDVGGEMLLVSQFTLLGDCQKGRRPSFVGAAQPDKAEALYEALAAHVRSAGVAIQTGVFRATMQVALLNDGPVTLLLDSREREK